jgi:trans-aconitate methyltransferase
MNTIEKANIIYYHRQCLQENKEPATVMGWRDAASQQKRFEALTSIASMSGSVVMDLGCGLGDLKPFLDQRFQDFVYLGVDYIPEFIDEATKRYAGLRDTFFQQADFTVDGLPHVDYVLASGALNYKTSNDLFVIRMIEKMYTLARKGVAFNLLDKEKFPPDDLLRAYHKHEILGFCLRLANRAELVTGYADDDFTIMLYK